jgi:PncC family amidohydrolase
MDEPQAGSAGTGEAVESEARLRSLAEQVQGHCVGRGLTLSTAESCTGGLIAHVITEIPGSSAYFLGGIVSYSDAVKASELGVPAEMLERHGAVSAQVAGAMASGARARLHAHLAVAVTGIAGPAGGSAAKPVGLTYVAVADEAGLDVRRFTWHGDRTANKLSSARAALALLLERLGEGTAP